MSPVPTILDRSVEQFIPPRLRNHARDYFAYSVDFLPLAANQAASQTFQVQSDSDFLLMAATATARDPAAVGTVFQAPAITVQLESSGSGRLLFNRAVDFRNIYGDSQLPFLMPHAKYLDGNSTFQTTLTNLNGAGGQDYDVRVTYHGFKIFNFSWDAS